MIKPGHSLLNACLGALFAWLLGLALFVHDAMGFIPPDKAGADGIVVLTGGSERIGAGLDLLAASAAPKLLISGVDPRTTGKDLIPRNHAARRKVNCCITFGTYAADTYGNARETATWAARDKMKSLLIVTAHYHMRRSLVEFRLAMPEVDLIPYPIAPGKVRLDNWWDYPGTASLLINEYNKLLLAYARAPLHALFDEQPLEDAPKEQPAS